MKTKEYMLRILVIIGIIVITFGVSTAFFNYMLTGTPNVIKVGRISFVTNQTNTIDLTNAFPINRESVNSDTINVGTVEINIQGDTDYADGIEYLITAENMHNTTSNGRVIPIALDISIINLGEENSDYFEERDGYSKTIYKRLIGDALYADQRLLVGYIKHNETLNEAAGINGKIVIKAYIDDEAIAISDTYDRTELDNMGTTIEWARRRSVLTTDEWNDLQNEERNISFQVKIEARQGIWVSEKESIKNVDYIYNNVQALIEDPIIQVGKIAATKGYYSEQLGGSAKYLISDNNNGFNNDTDFILNNGLYAKLIIENDTITVNQYGAYGDGVHDDTLAIRKAINSGNAIVEFEGNRYKCNGNIVLGVSDVVLDGKDSVLFIDDDYYYETVGTYRRNQFYFFSINSNINDGIDINSDKIENIKIKNITFENLITGEDPVDGKRCQVQMRIYNVSGLELDKVNFVVPEYLGKRSFQCMNLWLYAGWDNIVIHNCRFINESKSSIGCTGVTIGSRNHELLSENVLLENNYFSKKGHDELIAVFSGQIKNVIIKNNEFYEDDREVDIPSDMLFSFGYDQAEEEIENIQFINNKIVTNSEMALFGVSANTTNPRNCIIKDNEITHTILDQVERLNNKQIAQFVFSNNDTASNEVATLEDNVINLTIESPDIEFTFAKHKSIISNNTINIYGNVKYYIYNTSRLRILNNNITFNDGCDCLLKNVYDIDFNDNIVDIKKSIGQNMLVYSTLDFRGNVSIDNNNITISDENTWSKNQKTLLLLYKTNMKEYTIEIKNNTIDVLNQNNSQLLANITGMEYDSIDLIKFINNTSETYKNINYWQNTAEIHLVVE